MTPIGKIRRVRIRRHSKASGCEGIFHSLGVSRLTFSFRLKYLFCLILIVGVALMWWTWYPGEEITAQEILFAREAAQSLKHPATIDDCLEAMGLYDKLNGQAELIGPANRIDPYPNSQAYSLRFDWHDESMYLHIHRYPYLDRMGKNARVRWQVSNAGWTAIEARAVTEQQTLKRQVIVTALAVLMIVVAVWPRRPNLPPKESV